MRRRSIFIDGLNTWRIMWTALRQLAASMAWHYGRREIDSSAGFQVGGRIADPYRRRSSPRRAHDQSHVAAGRVPDDPAAGQGRGGWHLGYIDLAPSLGVR